ncbi:hypothetical protein [Rhodohalobacter sp. 614A]|uniref:hypothetical protein n=1 Tax=Rhodohalobacter sp. 614A TaxID=2908649 RepID=UPI001F463AF2|nr:hypothetical protein [Rhodohalobacter sp. 614A]
MNKREFMNNVIEIYVDARNVRFAELEISQSKVRRGRSHTVSSTVEDLLACYLVDAFPMIDKIMLDQAITFQIGSKKKTIHPDLSIVVNNEIKCFIDLKMDLGRKREAILSIHEKAKSHLRAVCGKSVTYKDGITKEEFVIKVSEKASYPIAVISRKNININALCSQLDELCGQNGYKNSKYYFFTDGVHPNIQSSQKAYREITLLPDFDEFINDIALLINSN